MIDKYGRNIDYLRISLTDKCNLRCIYCMPSDVDDEDEHINNGLSIDEYKFVIKSMASVGIKKLRFTGGEPTLYPGLNELIRFAKNECNINDIAIIAILLYLITILFIIDDSKAKIIYVVKNHHAPLYAGSNAVNVNINFFKVPG